MTTVALYIGIDVSKDRLDLAWRPTGERWTAPNTERGIRAICRRLRTPAPTLIVLEATGGLELPLTGALAAAGLPVVVVNPRQIRDFAKATGQLAKTVQKASMALLPSHEEGRHALPTQERLNIDETGHPECGRDLWTWGFHAPGPQGFTWFHIDPARSSEVLKEFLGEVFAGVVGCDYHSAYRKFLRETSILMQFCWAHLIRDVKFLTTLPDRVTRRYGERLLAQIKRLFRVWHRRDEMPKARWQRAADQARRAVLEVGRRAPARSEAQNVATRFRAHADEYFTFLKLPRVEPTNNAIERAFRFLAQDRKLTQGTRGEAGRRWCERVWTVLATCAQQGRSAFHFIHESILAHFHKRSFPPLLPQPP